MIILWVLLIPLSINEGNYEIPIAPQERTEEAVAPKEDLREVTVTAYSIGDGNIPSTIMASGKRCYVGAVAYNDAPLGTKVTIDGKEYTVEDRMLYDGYIDIYMESVNAAKVWGVQRKTVRVEDDTAV